MVEDLRKRIIIIVGLLIGLLIVLILGALVFAPGDQNPDGNGQPQTGPVPDAGTAVPGATLREPVAAPNGEMQVAVENPGEIYVRQLAVLFVERFGTQSNQNKNVHIDDALVFASDSMARWLESQRQEDNAEHEGVTARAVTSEVTSYSEAQAQVLVDAIRDFTYSDKPDVRTYETARVDLIYVGGEWKVDGMYWIEG